MKFVELRNFPDWNQVHLAASKLESEGIECAILSDQNSATFPSFSDNSTSGNRIMVLESDYERASEILNIGFEKKAPPCPSCGNLNAEYIVTKNFFRILGLVVGAFLGLISPKRLEGHYLCSQCGTRFVFKHESDID